MGSTEQSRAGRSIILLLGALALTMLGPQEALAHGLVGRADLPVPTWLFAWAAILVLIVSFVALGVAWKSPRLEIDNWQPLPEALSNALTGAVAQVIAGFAGVVLFAMTVISGLFGAQDPLSNFAPAFIFVIFWVGLVPASAVLGDIFKAFNPWRALGKGVAALARAVTRGPLPAPLPYPDWLGRWPAAAGIFGFAWIELAYGSGSDPSTLAIAVLVYSALTFLAMSFYGVDAWIENGEAFSVYFNLFSRLSIFERRGDRVGLRPPLAGLTQVKAVAGTVPLLAVMLGTITFDGASEGPIWARVGPKVSDLFQGIGFGAESGMSASFTVGMLAGVLLVYGFYRIGIRGVATVGGDLETKALAARFVPSLIPIAAAYAIAHYFSLLAYQGQTIWFLSSDPLGHGWNLFATAGGAIDYTVITATGIWYVQVATLVIGHVCGLVLAHDRALVLYRTSHVATRSQYWMLLIMIGFTSLGLWLLSQANA